MTIKVPKQEIRVKIKTKTSLIIGTIHIMTGGRVIDYMNSQTNKFIPVTDADVQPFDMRIKDELNIKGRNDVIFLNTEDIEMIVSLKEEK
jgi:hypothetical protein